jgi:hypothetical protein
VAVIVPGQGGDPIAPLNAETLQRVRELASAGECVAIGVPMSGIVGDDRNDLTSRVLEFCMAPCC